MNYSMNKRIAVHIAVMMMFSILALLVACNVVDVNLSCFSVDDSGNLYVGKTGKIEVYEGEKLIRTINSKTSRGYMFTIQDDNTILLSTASTVYCMDLYGNVLSSWKDEGTRVYNELQYKRNKFTASSGDTYWLKGRMGWTKIVKNGTAEVYRIPMGVFAVKLGLYIGVANFVVLISTMLKHRLRQLQSQMNMQ